MEKYTYKARSEDGKLVTGKIESRDERAAVELLRQRKLLVVSLKVWHERQIPIIGRLFSGVKHSDLVNFTRQLSTMITAGLSVTNSLAILETQSETAMAQVVAGILRDVEAGTSLAGALAKYPKVFSGVYIALVRVGEAAGVLDTVLKRLAANLEKEREFRGRIKGALIYPAIVVTGMAVVGVVMMVFVIPKLTAMYRDFGAELPLATKILIGVSEGIIRWWYVVAALVIGTGMFGRVWIKTPMGRYRWDLWLLKLPIVGVLQVQVILTEFTRTMALLVNAGMSVLDGLGIIKRALGNAVFEASVSEVSLAVEKGFPLATALAQQPHFPPIVSQMVAVGEETGKLDEVLEKLSNYFESEAEQKVKALTTAIEPLIMILLGVGVGFLVIAVILPIYNLTSQF